MTLRLIHRSTAMLLALFIVTHLTVHLFAVAGPDPHSTALTAVQWVYRNPVGEAVLVLAIIVQIITGASRLRYRRQRGWGLVQAISGTYLLIFLLLHPSAALYTHHLFGIETDFYWSAGSLYYDSIRYGFAVYYTLAIVAVFSHLGAAVHYNAPSLNRLATLMPAIGLLIGATIVLSIGGAFYPIDLPAEVASYYQQIFGVE
ncbi:MAG: hypothetical protein AAGH76_08945 [Pseudomonadota bacterium]